MWRRFLNWLGKKWEGVLQPMYRNSSRLHRAMLLTDHGVTDWFFRCNVLVNNAGVLRDKSLVKADKETGKGVKNMTKQDWDIVMNVNLTGPFLCAREFAAQAIGTEVPITPCAKPEPARPGK
jgi:NAD(P)-dependent dehydrogenase (short-subunit alcohol dehydrogenase family)